MPIAPPHAKIFYATYKAAKPLMKKNKVYRARMVPYQDKISTIDLFHPFRS